MDIQLRLHAVQVRVSYSRCKLVYAMKQKVAKLKFGLFSWGEGVKGIGKGREGDWGREEGRDGGEKRNMRRKKFYFVWPITFWDSCWKEVFSNFAPDRKRDVSLCLHAKKRRCDTLLRFESIMLLAFFACSETKTLLESPYCQPYRTVDRAGKLREELGGPIHCLAYNLP